MNDNLKEEISQKSIEEFLINTHRACERLNSCLPQGQKIELKCNLNILTENMDYLAKKIVASMESYQRNLQNLQENLRKHIKNEIELKLYYEHLEEVITNLKKDKQRDIECIESLKTELKDKEKYLMTITNHNTKSGDEIMGGLQSKLDTITKIKNRLSLNDTGEYYGRNYPRRNQREYATKDLHHKRQNLANALEKLCEKPEQRSLSSKKNKQKSKSKGKKQLNSSRSKKQLHRNKSGKNLPSNIFVSHSPAQKGTKTRRVSVQKQGPGKMMNYIKSGLSSRRNSKC